VVEVILESIFATRNAAAGPAGARARRPSSGFTIIELLMVVVILAIMAALAAPSMSRLVATQRLKSVATDLHLALVKARAEAIKRNASVTVSPTDGSWTAGWSMAETTTPDLRLDVRGPSSSVSISTTATQVIYRETGRTTPAAGVSFVITSTRTDAARCLSIDPSGRPYLKEGSTC
jgi:type IV fimbrial biogenesis protein FimT